MINVDKSLFELFNWKVFNFMVTKIFSLLETSPTSSKQTKIWIFNLSIVKLSSIDVSNPFQFKEKNYMLVPSNFPIKRVKIGATSTLKLRQQC
jgi:hypothetical protein